MDTDDIRGKCPFVPYIRNIFSRVDLRDIDGLTILLVDQEIREALKIADYVYVLELGRNKFEGGVEEFTDLEKAFWV